MHNEKFYAYARVSTIDQKLERQFDGIKIYCKNNNIDFDKVIKFSESKSGKDLDRPQYQNMKSLIKKGDTLIVKELDRLARNKEDIKKELEYYRNIGVIVRILNIPTTLIELPKENVWVMEMINNILIEVLSAVAQEEREKMLQRQSEGIAAAKKTGKHLGRFPMTVDDIPNEFYKYYGWVQDGIMNKSECARILGISRPTLYRWLEFLNDKERQEKNELKNKEKGK